jgi:hypothetical protein
MATDTVMFRFGVEIIAAVALVAVIGFLVLLIMRS